MDKVSDGLAGWLISVRLWEHVFLCLPASQACVSVCVFFLCLRACQESSHVTHPSLSWKGSFGQTRF